VLGEARLLNKIEWTAVSTAHWRAAELIPEGHGVGRALEKKRLHDAKSGALTDVNGVKEDRVDTT
jgi:hypothetical protein